MVPLFIACVALVPHAAFPSKTALDMYKGFMPPPSTVDGIVYTAPVDRRLAVQSILRNKSSFMILGDGGANINVFFCTAHVHGGTEFHCVEASIVHEDNEGDAMRELEAWHEVRFPGKMLVMV